jgi:hypothetical protein
MSATPNSFMSPQTPWSAAVRCTAANTDIDTPTATVTLIAAADNPNGMRIEGLWAINSGALGSPNHFQLYSMSGATKMYIDGRLSGTPAAPAAGVTGVKTPFEYSDINPLILGPGIGLEVAIGVAVADGVTFMAIGGKY